MNNLSLIAAIGPNMELGYNNQLLWHIKDDLAFYKKMTMNKNIIMGRLTFESMPKSALIGRKPIVLTSNNILTTDKTKYFNNIKEVLELIQSSNEEFMVVGGAYIYKQFLPYVDTMYLTLIDDGLVHNADVYFPYFDENNWYIELLKEGNQEKVNYKIKKYVRKQS